MRFTVIGAANVDIITKSNKDIIHGDSNPASVMLAAGGVGFNIAATLSRLGADVDFITAVGPDPLSSFLRSKCEALGIATGSWIVKENMSTSVYSAALNNDGELYVAFNAMAVHESLRRSDLLQHEKTIAEADLLIIDANLTEDTLEAILDLRGGNPVMADAVSASKAPRLKNLLKRITILKMNRTEAECLTGLTLDTSRQLELACDDILSSGVMRVFITLGADGVFAADKGGAILAPAVSVAIRNVTGAGDAFAAGVALRIAHNLKAQAEYGVMIAAQHLKEN